MLEQYNPHSVSPSSQLPYLSFTVPCKHPNITYLSFTVHKQASISVTASELSGWKEALPSYQEATASILRRSTAKPGIRVSFVCREKLHHCHKWLWAFNEGKLQMISIVPPLSLLLLCVDHDTSLDPYCSKELKGCIAKHKSGSSWMTNDDNGFSFNHVQLGCQPTLLTQKCWPHPQKWCSNKSHQQHVQHTTTATVRTRRSKGVDKEQRITLVFRQPHIIPAIDIVRAQCNHSNHKQAWPKRANMQRLKIGRYLQNMLQTSSNYFFFVAKAEIYTSLAMAHPSEIQALLASTASASPRNGNASPLSAACESDGNRTPK